MNVTGLWKSWFVLLGSALLLLLLGWIIFSLATYPFVAQVPKPDGPEIRGEDPKMPVMDMEATVDKAKEVMDSKYRTSHRWRWAGRVADWLGFILTALITVIVGATGQILRQGDDAITAAQNAAASGAINQGSRLMIAVGVMAALSSVMIGVSSRLQSESQRSLEQAEKLRALIASSRKEFVDVSTPAAWTKVIDDLDAATKQNQ